MKKIINEILSTIYCKYIHYKKIVNNDNFKCRCTSCKYFKECDISEYTYILNKLDELNMLYVDVLFKGPDNNSELMEISYQANTLERNLKYYDEK